MHDLMSVLLELLEPLHFWLENQPCPDIGLGLHGLFGSFDSFLVALVQISFLCQLYNS